MEVHDFSRNLKYRFDARDSIGQGNAAIFFDAGVVGLKEDANQSIMGSGV